MIAFKGLRVLTTLIPLIDPLANPKLSHPRKTTLKSKIFHPSLKYECSLIKNPIAIILKTISLVYKIRKTKSIVPPLAVSIAISLSSARKMQLDPITKRINQSNHGLTSTN